MLTLDEATARAKRMVQDFGERLDPGDDWVPCVFTYGERNCIIMIPELGDPGAKDVICQIALPALVGELAPDWAALVSMGWAIKYQDTLESTARRARDEAVGYVGGSYAEHPDKVGGVDAARRVGERNAPMHGQRHAQPQQGTCPRMGTRLHARREKPRRRPLR